MVLPLPHLSGPQVGVWVRRPTTAVERWLVREGWRFLRWNVSKDLLAASQPLNGWLMGMGAAALPLGWALADPRFFFLPFPLLAIAGANWGIHLLVKDADGYAKSEAPKLSPRARLFLDRMVRRAIGIDLLGVKFGGRILRAEAAGIKKGIEEVIQPEALEAWEGLCESYNRLSGICREDLSTRQALLDAAEAAMSAGLDWVADLDRFPEKAADLVPRIRELAGQFQKLADAAHALPQGEPSPRDLLSPWLEVLEEEAPQVQEER